LLDFHWHFPFAPGTGIGTIPRPAGNFPKRKLLINTLPQREFFASVNQPGKRARLRERADRMASNRKAKEQLETSGTIAVPAA
jgi:hypothetical protein